MNIFSKVTLALLISTVALADGSHMPINLNPIGVDSIGSASISTINLEIDLSDSYGKGFFIDDPSSKSEEFINQGYASLNVFHYVDAYRSFKMAYGLNNESIYALIGMSFSVLTQDTSASGAKLASLALNESDKISKTKDLSKKEKAWLGFAKAFYLMKIGNDQLLDDKNARNNGNTFQELANVDGDNLEFKTFVHWILLNNNNFQYIKSVLESVVMSEPSHAGANHYLLHIAEMVDDIKSAQSYGKSLINLALGSAHAQHMYGHTLPQTGDWKKALEQFLIADKIHHDWSLKNGVDISEDWHYSHNLDLLASTYLGLGDYENALNNWSTSMKYDARAIQKMIGLALATNQVDLAKRTLSDIEGISPQYKQFVSFLRSEEKFLTTGIAPSIYPQEPFAQLLMKTYQKSLNELDLVKEFEQYFGQKFAAGGFDGWSNGFVELMRAKNISSRLKMTSLEKALANLELMARNGQM